MKRTAEFHPSGDGQRVLIAENENTPFERGNEAEGFLIVTAAANKGLVNIGDQCPLVLLPEAARECMKQDEPGKGTEKIAADGSVSAENVIRHP